MSFRILTNVGLFYFNMCEDLDESKFIEMAFGWGHGHIWWIHTTLEGQWPHYMILEVSWYGLWTLTFFWALTIWWSRLLARVQSGPYDVRMDISHIAEHNLSPKVVSPLGKVPKWALVTSILERKRTHLFVKFLWNNQPDLQIKYEAELREWKWKITTLVNDHCYWYMWYKLM